MKTEHMIAETETGTKMGSGERPMPTAEDLDQVAEALVAAWQEFQEGRAALAAAALAYTTSEAGRAAKLLDLRSKVLWQASWRVQGQAREDLQAKSLALLRQQCSVASTEHCPLKAAMYAADQRLTDARVRFDALIAQLGYTSEQGWDWIS